MIDVTYINATGIKIAQDSFTVSQVFAVDGKPVRQQLVIMAPRLAKAFHKSLSNAIADYEKQHGYIPDGSIEVPQMVIPEAH